MHKHVFGVRKCVKKKKGRPGASVRPAPEYRSVSVGRNAQNADMVLSGNMGYNVPIAQEGSKGLCIRLNAEERYTAAELIREPDKVSG